MSSSYGYDEESKIFVEDFIWCTVCEEEYTVSIEGRNRAKHREILDYAINKAFNDVFKENKEQLIENLKKVITDHYT